VEQWGLRDHEAEWKEWEGYLQTVINALEHLPSIQTDIRLPGRSNVAPVLGISWDPQVIEIEPQEALRQLSEGEPRIEMNGGKDLSIMPYMMEPGEDVLVASRLREILESRVNQEKKRTS